MISEDLAVMSGKLDDPSSPTSTGNRSGLPSVPETLTVNATAMTGNTQTGDKGQDKRFRSKSGDFAPARKRGTPDSSEGKHSSDGARASSVSERLSSSSPADLKDDMQTDDDKHGKRFRSKSDDPALARRRSCQGSFGRVMSGPPPLQINTPLSNDPDVGPKRLNQTLSPEMSAMELDKKEFQNMVNIICRKMAHVIVESRLGKKIHTPCKVHADVPDWFNLSTEDMPEVVKEVKRLLASSGGLWDPAVPVNSFCVEISLKTADGVPLVLEQWSLTLDTTAATGARPSANIVNQLGILLKSLVVTTRLTVGYRLSRRQSQESHILFYKIYVGEPDLQGLGEASEQMTIGEVGTPICSLSLAVHYRTKLALSTYSDPIVMKSDHFKPEQSPRVRRVTGFAERRHSDSVEMIGASSSSSSNMDTKTTGGSSTDSDQRRRVAAFADDPVERPAPPAEVPFSRLIGEPPPATDVSMTDGGPQPPRRVAPEPPRPVTAAAAAAPAAAGPSSPVTAPITGGAAPPGSPAPDDFVMVELRTPFSENDSDSELGTFFRQCQAVPSLPSVAERPAAAPAAAAAAGSPPTGDLQVLSLSQQLQKFQLKSQEFDEMIAQLSEHDK